jgi:hypothetical protein
MRFPRGFPKPHHYSMMKRRGMLSSFYPQQTKNRVASRAPSEHDSTKVPWWGWILLVIVLSAILKVCGYG